MISQVISHILLDSRIQDHPYTKHVLTKFPNAQISTVDTPNTESLTPWIRSKRTLYLTTFPSTFIKDCPATGSPYLCCRYRILSPVVGCSIDCSYCILQHYVGQQPIRVYVNWEELFDQVKGYTSQYPNQLIRVGSGELADSLALEPQLGMVARWIPFFGTLSNAVLELKTKSAKIDWLESIPHQGRTVIGWSLNPQQIIETEERGASSVDDRISAAVKVASWGYKVAFHFDPILNLPGWESQYQELVKQLCSAVPAESVAWVSLGSLRFPPPLREVIRKRFPKTNILTGEWIRGIDGKTRMIKPLRIKMFQKLCHWLINGWGENVYVYLCMESASIWRESLGWEPKSREEVEQKFQDFWVRKFT